MLQKAKDAGQEYLVLGAAGCGVFNSDPNDVADVWKELLDKEFRGVFKEGVFAITGQAERAPFETKFST